MIEFLKRTGVYSFTLIKYIEVVFTALSTFILAKKIGPNQMGIGLPVFLYITYANYLSLGLNQVVLKNYSRINHSEKNEFIRFNFQYYLIISLVNVSLSFKLLDTKFALISSLISNSLLFRSFFTSYFRSIDKVYVLSINNFLYSALILFLVIIFVNDLISYLFVWLMISVFVLLLYYAYDIKFFNEIFKSIHIFPSVKTLKFNITEGVKLALSSIISTIYLTSDRFIVNKIDIDIEFKGSLQLSDYFGTAIYILITTIIFYFYPKLIAKVRESSEFRNKLLSYISYTPFYIIIILVFSYIFLYYTIPIFFAEYPNLLILVISQLFTKLMVISIGFLSLYFIGMDDEKRFLIINIIPLLILIFMGYFFIKFNFNEIHYISIAIGLLLLTMFLLTIRILKN